MVTTECRIQKDCFQLFRKRYSIGEYDISADELLNGDGRGQKSRKAKEFLLEILANGGMTQKKIAEEAETRGIKSKTLWNAKRELEIDSVKRGKQWYWMLPE